MGEARRKLEDNKVPTATMAQIGPIDAKQCPECHTIYPQMQGVEVEENCKGKACSLSPLSLYRATKTRDIKVTIHYGEEGAF